VTIKQDKITHNEKKGTNNKVQCYLDNRHLEKYMICDIWNLFKLGRSIFLPKLDSLYVWKLK